MHRSRGEIAFAYAARRDTRVSLVRKVSDKSCLNLFTVVGVIINSRRGASESKRWLSLRGKAIITERVIGGNSPKAGARKHVVDTYLIDESNFYY